MSEDDDIIKPGDPVEFTPIQGKPEKGRAERTLPRVIIIEFDDKPGQYFQVSRDRVRKIK